MNRLTQEKRAGIIKLYYQQKSYEEIAQELSVGRNTILRLVKELKLTRDILPSKRKGKIDISDEEALQILNLYNSGKSCRQISLSNQMSIAKIQRVLLSKYGIDTSTNNPTTIPFLECSNELKQQIVELYLAGGSSRDVAAQTNVSKETVLKIVTERGAVRDRLEHNFKHGDLKSPEYIYWGGFKVRLKKQGKSLCEDWSENFPLFKEFLIKNGWKKGDSLVLINESDEVYTPENSKIITRSEKSSLVQYQPDVQAKKIASTREKYGVDFYTQTPEYLEIVRQTSLAKYGVEHHSQSEVVKVKISDTCLEKYGHTCVLSSQETKDKIKEANLAKYGVEYPSQCEDVMLKVKKTQLDNNITKVYEGYTLSDMVKITGYSRGYCKKIAREKGGEYVASLLKNSNYTIIEDAVKKILDKHNIKYIYDSHLVKFRPDFLLPDHKIIIECDGLYWHSDAIQKDKNYHAKKMEFYKSQGYTTLFFREDEIANKLDVVSSIILNKVGLAQHMVFARKCTVRELSIKEYSEFYNTNHLMGSLSGKTLGLIHNGEIVAAMQFHNKKYYTDITRFACKNYHSVIGGYSKLFAQIPKEKPIHTFVDMRYGSGSHLEKLGFEKQKVELSFRWVKNNTSYHRRQFLGSTGYDNGCSKLWDCGQALFILS